jgi:hypothetical protein
MLEGVAELLPSFLEETCWDWSPATWRPPRTPRGHRRGASREIHDVLANDDHVVVLDTTLG